MRPLIVDKVASVAQSCRLGREVRIAPEIPCEEGVVIAVEVLSNKSTYNTLELVSGRMAQVKRGDIVVGALGHRHALFGYSGHIPEKLAPGDKINLLNLGGVMGICDSVNRDRGQPFECRVLGTVLHFPYLGERIGTPARVGSLALPDDPVVETRGIPAIALISVLAGLDAGVKRLSEINMVLAIALLVFVIAVGPTIAIMTGFFDNLGAYLQYLPALANPVGRDDANFSQGWTAFYWAWWISWSPFVGMFIARVSRGRTVREFIVSVLIVPSLACVLWMTVFGGTAILQLVNDGYQAVAGADLPLQLFLMLEVLPLAQITSFLAIVLVVVFFVTSSDSGSLVIDVISAGGKIDAPTPQRVFWCVFEGLVAIALILGGGLVALQAMAVSTGFPFAVVLLVATVSVIKGLASEPRA